MVEQILLFGPELILTLFALIVLTVDLLSERQGRAWSPWITLTGFLLALADSLALLFGQWGNPQSQGVFGTLYSSDLFLSFFRVISLVLAVLMVFASKEYIEKRTRYIAEFYGFLLFVILAMILMAGSADLIMLFLSFEFLSITSYIMVAYLRDDKKSSEAGLKYFLYGAVSSAIMLYGFSLIYGVAGTTNLQGIQTKFAEGIGAYQGLVAAAIALAIAGFGFKIALAPFHQWSPDAYEGAPTPVTAFISVGPKIAGFAILARVMHVALPSVSWDWFVVLWGVAAFSMTLGNLTALRQTNIKRLLAYSSIAQTGYMLIGIVANVATGDGVRGILVYLVAYIFTNIGLFLIVIAYSNAINSDEIEDYAGMIRRAPALALALLIFFLSLAGIPPTAGFIGKFLVFGSALKPPYNEWLVTLAIIGAINSAISIGYYFNIVRLAFFAPPKDETPVAVSPMLNWSIAGSTALTLLIGLFPPPVIDFAQQAAQVLFKAKS